MRLNEYQVWHTFGTFFVEPFRGHLEDIAMSLVANRYAVTAVTSSGHAFALGAKGDLEHGDLTITSTPDKSKSVIKCSLLESEGYATEAILQSAWLLSAEQRVTSPLLQESAPYFRAFLDPIRLSNQNVRVLLYPQVKVYENGVFLIQFRVFSPQAGQPLEDFVRNILNLQWMDIEGIQVSPFLLAHFDEALLATAYPHRWQSRKVTELATKQTVEHLKDANQVNEGDFDFTFVEVPAAAYEMYDTGNFRFVHELLVSTLSRLMAQGRGRVREVL